MSLESTAGVQSEAMYQQRSACGVAFGLADFTETTGRSVQRLEPSQPRLKILIAQQDIALGGLREVLTTHKAFVVGPSCPPLRSMHDGTLSCLEIDLPPWAGTAVFGEPGHDGPLALSDLIGSAADALAEQLSAAADAPARLALAERFVARRLEAGAQRICPEIRWAWDRLQDGGGRNSIRALADDIGWSGRHFGQRFAQQTGLLPKTALRMMRFDRACRLVEQTQQPLADIAFACGYADQSHMTREFLAFAARPPDAHRKARLSDLPGTSPAPAPA